MPDQIDATSQHARQAILNLPPMDLGKPNTMSVAWALGAEIQELEDAIWSVINKRFIDGAGHEQLRVIGQIVGQIDEGFGTETFRRAIKARILANKSQGGINDVLAVFRVFHASPGLLQWAPVYPAKLLLTAEDVNMADLTALLHVLRDTKMGGVGLSVLATGGTGMRFSSSTGGGFGAGAMSSANRDLITILNQTPDAQLSGFDLPVGPGASWTWPAAAGSGFDTTTATVGAGWFGLPTSRLDQDNLSSLGSLHAAHVGQINLPWCVAGAVKVDSGQAIIGRRAFWSISTSSIGGGYKLLGIDWETGLTNYRHANDAGTLYTIAGAAFPLDVEVIVAHYFDGTNVTVLALDPLSGNISELIPATAVGASGAFAAPNAAWLGGTLRVGTDLNTDMDVRALLWVNSPTFGIEALKAAMRHLCQPPATSLPGVGGLFSINPRV